MELTEQQRAVAETGAAVMARIVELKGFSTVAVDDLVVIGADGVLHGDLLGRPGAERLGPAAVDLIGSDRPGLEIVEVAVHGPQVQELGLSCGGQADILLQTVADVPPEFWAALDGRVPVALVTVMAGPAAGPAAVAVGRAGEIWGTLAPTVPEVIAEELVATARGLLREGRTGRRQVETTAGRGLIEAWVPAPRIVVVGGGDIVEAVAAQAGLLGWEVRAVDGSAAADQLPDLLVWAGATGALVVCSHDPHVDTPALAAGLVSGTPYVGAMGSRGTQSRRMERLRADGLTDDQIDPIHRPIGLDLGGRRAPEVALSIVAEILACHCGRDGRFLRDSTGPIHG